MKLSRITAVVAAASIAPAVFLAAPAVADGADAKPPVTAGAEEKPGPAGGEKSSAEETDTTLPGRTVEVPNFPEKLTAGGDWTEFSFVLDNKNAEGLKNFSLSFWLNSGTQRPGKLDPKDPRATKLLYRTRSGSATSAWKSMVDTVTGSTVRGERQFGAIPKGDKLTVELRIRLGDAFPAGQATTIVNTPEGVEAPSLRDITVVAKDGGKTDPTGPKPTASATTGGGTKTKDPKTDPSPKASATATPTTSATATATATPSASASPTWTAAGTTTGTTTGGSSELAKTGAGSSTPWAVAGSAGALALGTGLVVMARRRGANGG